MIIDLRPHYDWWYLQRHNIVNTNALEMLVRLIIQHHSIYYVSNIAVYDVKLEKGILSWNKREQST